MKVTNEELLKLFKLKVGDVVVIKDFYVGEDNICKARVVERKAIDGTDKILLNLINVVGQISLCSLAMYEYEIRQAKKIGDTTCCDYLVCSNCPLQHLKGCDNNKEEETLYTKLNREFPYTDDPIYKAYKAILDKEE